MEKLFKACQLKAVKDTGEVEAIIATFNVIDKDGDITLPGFFGRQETKMLSTHDWDSITLGKGEVFETKEHAIARIKMNLEIQAAREWHSALKFDLKHGTPLQEWSYGFRLKEGGWSRGEMGTSRVRYLQPLADGSPGVKVDEVSPVVVGAGEGTQTLAVKSAKGGIRFCDEAEAVLAAVKAFADRASSLAEMRGKDERALSSENIEKVLGIKAGLLTLGESLDALAVDGDGKEDLRKELRRIQLSRVLRGEAEA